MPDFFPYTLRGFLSYSMLQYANYSISPKGKNIIYTLFTGNDIN